jgi:hypothetical protein
MFTQSAVEQCHDQKQPGMFPGLLYWELVGVYGTQIFAKYWVYMERKFSQNTQISQIKKEKF